MCSTPATRPTGPVASATSSSASQTIRSWTCGGRPAIPSGWEHSFAHEWRDFLTAVIDDRPLRAGAGELRGRLPGGGAVRRGHHRRDREAPGDHRRDARSVGRRRRSRHDAARRVGIGMVGAGTMASAHSLALSLLGRLYPDLPIRPRLVAVADVNDRLAARLAGRYGYRTRRAATGVAHRGPRRRPGRRVPAAGAEP